MTTGTKSEFEVQLEQYFPDIYKLHQLGKFDPKLWETLAEMATFSESRQFGEFKIVFQDGKINHAYKTVTVMFESDKLPYKRPVDKIF